MKKWKVKTRDRNYRTFVLSIYYFTIIVVYHIIKAFLLSYTLVSSYTSIDVTLTSGNKYQCQYYYNYMNYLYSWWSSVNKSRQHNGITWYKYVFVYFVCNIMKCLLITTTISNLNDSCYQQCSCHLCTMSTFTTYQECD